MPMSPDEHMAGFDSATSDGECPVLWRPQIRGWHSPAPPGSVSPVIMAFGAVESTPFQDSTA